MLSNIETIVKHRPVLLMLDYDGTLVPIIECYEQAFLTSEQSDFIRHLTQLPWVQVAIVSGRSVVKLTEFFKDLSDTSLLLVGLHGGEVYDMQNGYYIEEPSEDYKKGISQLKRYLIDKQINKLSGISLEDKGYSLGVHYRGASNDVSEKAIETLKSGWQDLNLCMDFILRPGKKLLEAVPKGFNKGVGVKHLLDITYKRFDQKPSLIYIGDDITDFDAFSVVNDLNGASVYVGRKTPENAPPVTLMLQDVPVVYSLLRQLFLTV